MSVRNGAGNTAGGKKGSFLISPSVFRCIILLILLGTLPLPVLASGGIPLVTDNPGIFPLISALHSAVYSSGNTTSAQPAKTVKATDSRAGTRIAETISILQQSARLRTVIVLIIALVVGAFIVYYLFSRALGGHRQKAAKSPLPNSRATVVEAPRSMEVLRDVHSAEGPAVQFPPSLEKKYKKTEFIGEGGLARVFRAERAKDGKVVAVKVPIRYDEATVTHFIRDIAAWQGLDHRNIIGISAANILPVPYIEMEYAPTSLSLKKLPLSEADAIALLRDVARGVAYAHSHGIVHRDLKPDNILIAADGTPKITDWGLAKPITDMRESATVSFSPAYAAPEQLAPARFGRPGPATDIYQLGVLLYEVLTGDVPFRQGGLQELNQAIISEDPPEPVFSGKHVSEIRQIIQRCMRKDPGDRYRSVDELIQDLDVLI